MIIFLARQRAEVQRERSGMNSGEVGCLDRITKRPGGGPGWIVGTTFGVFLCVVSQLRKVPSVEDFHSSEPEKKVFSF